MNLRARIRSSMDMATGTQQFVPSQAFFIQTNAIGRWQADFDTGAFAHTFIHRRHPDGTVDSIRMEPNFDHYLELNGRGGRDVAAGRI